MAKKLKRWNYKKHKYEDYEVPDNWDVKAYAFDLDTFVDCASCGTGVPYGITYTSMEIHTDMGIGYSVCHECYEEECKRRFKDGKAEKTTGNQMPQCGCKLEEGEWYQRCRRCGYSKHREPSNLTKRLFGF